MIPLKYNISDPNSVLQAGSMTTADRSSAFPILKTAQNASKTP